MAAVSEVQAAECRRMEAGFNWIEGTVEALDDSKLSDGIYRPNKTEALKRIRALRSEVLFLYHVLGIRDEHP